MQKIAIITDTDSSLPFEVGAHYDIYQVPIIVNFGAENYEAVYAINDADTFRRIDQEGKLPTTAAPTPGNFEIAFKRAFDAGADEILCLCVSSQVSSTYQSALVAAESFKAQRITVVDSHTLSMGLGYMALAAAEAVAQGATIKEIIPMIIELRQRTHLFAALSTLKYLVMGGRVSNIAGSFASMLNIKPILTIRDGKLELIERVRTQKKSWERVIELSALAIGERHLEKVCILHVDSQYMATQFESELRLRMECPKEILFAEVTPGLSVHSGAGMVGVVFVVK